MPTDFRTRTVALATALMGAALSLPAAPREGSPNVVLILADDLGWVDTSFTGSRFYRTPNIERLARQGVYFPNAYSASPLCSPTRASIMTGQSPARCGITAPACHTPRVVLEAAPGARAKPTARSTNSVSVTRLTTSHYTLAKAMKDGGYATGHFGKWHLGAEPYSPLEHGFDVDIPHWPGPGPAGSFVAPWRYRNFEPRTPKEHIEDRMGDEAVAFMEAHKDEPFYLNYWQFSVHAPFDAKEELIDAYRERVDPENPQQSPTYAAMVHSLDDNVGKILDALERLGLADSTVLIFYSDNGGNMYNHVDGGTATSNAPLRGGKASLYEGGIRVPAIVSWPGVTKGGTVNTAIVQSEDLYPTILEMAGLPVRKEQARDAVSMVPALKGRTPLREAMFSYFPHSPGVPDWMPPAVCVRQGAWKLIRAFHDTPEQNRHRYELYNLADDIGERANLAAREPERVRALDALIESFLERTGAARPAKNPNYDAEAVDTVAGWKVASPDTSLGRNWETLQVRAFTEAPVLVTETPLDLPAGAYRFEVRLRSWAPGPVRLEDARGSTIVSLSPKPDGLWGEIGATATLLNPLTGLRLLPASAPGTVQFRWLRIRDAAGKVVKEWDFAKRPPAPRGKPQPVVGGWQAGPNGHAKAGLKNGALQLNVSAGDPMIMSAEPLSAPAGQYTLTIRMNSEAGGNGQVFARPTARGYQPGTGTAFLVTHDGEWNDYEIALNRDHPIHEIRIDPCTAPGTVLIERIVLKDAAGTTVKAWTFGDR